jgi:hypothetical protein
MKELNQFVITFDIDWAPDFVIDAVASMLQARRVRATWFVTHQCAALDRLREESELFELGLHPNFLPGSTHGNTPAEVLEHVRVIVPEATSIRTHSLVQSGSLLNMIMQAGLKTDVSIFLPGMPNIRPFEFRLGGRTVTRVPYFWSDDYEMEKISPSWHLAPLLEVKGIKVLNFHPLLLYLNLSNLGNYHTIKSHAPELNKLTLEAADAHIQPGGGPKTFFSELTDHLASVGESFRVRDIVDLAVDGKR